ncbi:DUF6430 domain-containing protein [Sphaerisporangium rubeum]|uniref:Bacterial transcriptional activator domain-containing protein n=1 Tax=Sphaerisporangium rubeum TaxID=321317 RepID=A0A7X0IC76_9ACTN|nr:macro domain-containing protein [Sphaerisporangium rubeum]MBB6472456.1 hypothetical protein [Sphaerisporangium rubeum]
MKGLRIRLLGQVSVETDEGEAVLRPLTAAVLIRLIMAEGESVTVADLYRDIWADGRKAGRGERNQVQKQIMSLRVLLNTPDSVVLSTERGQPTAYRLQLERATVDALRFQDLVGKAQQVDSVTAVELLEQALALWRGRPVANAAICGSVTALSDLLTRLQQTARRELLRAYQKVGRPEKALVLAERLHAHSPGDPELSGHLAAIREQLRARPEGTVFRRDLPELDTSLVIMPGDLFAQDDAHLVTGFTDTFDTAVEGDLVISDSSVQGQLLRRVYHGDRKRLDQELRAGLSHVPRVGTESRSTKPHGKLIRYPIGTVITLRPPGRCVFAVAYSRMGNDLVARSSVADLTLSLDNLWTAVYRHGQLRPVAIALVGSGLSRLGAAEPWKLLRMIIDSYLAAASRDGHLCKELRVILRASALEKIDMMELAKSYRETQ